MTAAHVSDEFFCERWRQIFFGTPTGEDLLPLTTVRYCRSKKRTDPNREDDPLDLAVVELRPDIAEKLSAFMRFVTLSELKLDPDKLKDGRYLVLGYPEFRAEKDEMDQTIVAQILPYFTGLYDMERDPAPNINPADHLVLDVNRMDEADGPGTGSTWTKRTKSAVAGCGVFWTRTSRLSRSTGGRPSWWRSSPTGPFRR